MKAIPLRLGLFVCLFCFLLAPRVKLAWTTLHGGYLATPLVIVPALPGLRRFWQERSFLASAFLLAGFAGFHYFMASWFDAAPLAFCSTQISMLVYLVFGAAFFSLAGKGYGLGPEPRDLVLLVYKLIFFVGLLNSVLILAEMALPGLRQVLESRLVSDTTGNVDYAETLIVARGLATSGGASLSVFQALALLLAVFLAAIRALPKVFALVGSCLILAATVFVGRTGLTVGLALLGILLAHSLVAGYRNQPRSLVWVVPVTAALVLAMHHLYASVLDSGLKAWAFEPFLKSFGQVGAVQEFKPMLVLPSDLRHLVLGVGFFDGVGRWYPRSDSGYIKTLTSIGLGMAGVLYGWIFWMIALVRRIGPPFGWLAFSLIVMMGILEIKEPFLYQNYAARALAMVGGGCLFLLGTGAVPPAI